MLPYLLLSTLPSHRWRAGPSATLLLILLSGLPRIALAAQVAMPLNIDYITLGEALKRQMYTAPGGRAELWNGSNQCQFFYAANPRFGRNAGSLKLDTGAELAIKLRVTNLNLYKPSHEKSLLVGRGFDLIKGNLIPRLEAFSFDLRPPLQQLDSLVQAAAAPDVAERVNTALSTLRPASAVIPEDESLRITLELTVPEVPTPILSSSAAPLTQAEIDSWQSTLDTWDAFMVFAIKQLGGAVADKEVRAQLLDLLLDSRHRLVEALGQPQAAGGPDPVRIIFIDEWSRLRVIIRSTAQRGMLGDHALEFLSFISAGDALFALDRPLPPLA